MSHKSIRNTQCEEGAEEISYLAIFTFVTTFVLYGGIMNICALVTSAGAPGAALSIEQMRLLYIQ